MCIFGLVFIFTVQTWLLCMHPSGIWMLIGFELLVLFSPLCNLNSVSQFQFLLQYQILLISLESVFLFIYFVSLINKILSSSKEKNIMREFCGKSHSWPRRYMISYNTSVHINNLLVSSVLYDILNKFQKGHSNIAVVYKDCDWQWRGCLGYHLGGRYWRASSAKLNTSF